MYNLQLDDQKLRLYVQGFDSSIKVIANQLLQGNSMLALRNLLPQLIEINNELHNLDQLVDNTNKITQEASNMIKDITTEATEKTKIYTNGASKGA